MRLHDSSKPQSQQRKGATLILMVALILVVGGMVAFAVDVGWMYLVRAQLQSAVDAGAIAASMQFQNDPDDVNDAVEKAKEFVQRNRVGWGSVVASDVIAVQAGYWDEGTRTFIPDSTKPDAIRVSAVLGDEPLMFGPILGKETFGTVRSAIARAGGNPMDIMMTLDLSGSMRSRGRIEALHSAAPTFIDVIEDVGDEDYIGVMGYGALADKYDPLALGHLGVSYLKAPAQLYPDDPEEYVGVLESPLTKNFGYLRDTVLSVDSLVASKYNGWTPVGAALRDSVHYLVTNGRADNDVKKFVVLMSDGRANKPNGNGRGYAMEMADYAVDQGIAVYTISLGNSADENLMQRIADRTGGQHFIARGSGSGLSASLTDAFRKVSRAIKGTELVH
ncbi:TadE/TadG family type IV pilus assembly protein [Stratiformator vulcanicus]|uniref:von Willebrand factor type A domain protein n=1 Tax=Stratiformator vulcanicus TaxID=2527980 RepID=A0A517R158_9PLAN|nr:TadE/TadG family type IV pilus assembly protein [Stratiformator vulcanicus]QDT37618.1 von Willebrand factor type A domain protein [Stratiformator vulcanicus]